MIRAKKTIRCNERFFALSEIYWYLKNLAFEKIEIFDGETGVFSRERELTANDFEMLAVAEK